MIFDADVKVNLKKGVADPEGRNTAKALNLLGFDSVKGVVSAKVFGITLEADSEEFARSQLDDMCRRLLANPVINNYSIEIRERK